MENVTVEDASVEIVVETSMVVEAAVVDKSVAVVDSSDRIIGMKVGLDSQFLPHKSGALK